MTGAGTATVHGAATGGAHGYSTGINGLVGALLMTGCATLLPEKGSMVSLYDPKPVSVEFGKASFYGGRDIGKPTANGERYHASNCTAAHKKLPFNTMVRVTNLRNGKSVLVRINDRGPFIKGRTIDLTVVPARQIEMISEGIVPVKIEVLKKIEVITKPNRVLERGS
jgi:rare lipoprotein A